ncbi:hypothetical protein llap_903 [Limosa lapponica baueri]|uniref:Rna-directed dna polymerase from mobile element jockey-like n=1 Tax=Limosa lapponica baueri TaxID=1758121 RepID=A0A2I0US12_LIMLA|nr:hypothetical protein llap_903 [Limosa lapponica baueri]
MSFNSSAWALIPEAESVVSASNRCPEPGGGSQVSRRTPGVQHKGLPVIPASKSASLGAQLKCLYANPRSMGNKQEELETCACLQGYDHIGIMETWWDVSCDWNVGMEGCRVFRKDKQGRQGRGVALYVKDQLECMELCLGSYGELTESLWVRSSTASALATPSKSQKAKAWSGRMRYLPQQNKHLNVPPLVRGPKLNAVLKVGPHQCRVQGDDFFSSPDGRAISDTIQDATGLLGHLGTMLAHIQSAVNQQIQDLFHQAAFQPLSHKPVVFHGIFVTQVQDPALRLGQPWDGKNL